MPNLQEQSQEEQQTSNLPDQNENVSSGTENSEEAMVRFELTESDRSIIRAFPSFSHIREDSCLNLIQIISFYIETINN